MKKSLLYLTSVLLLICALILPTPAKAAEAVDISAVCSLTLHYSKEGTAFPGLPIRIYRVAEFTSADEYQLTEAFRDYPVQIHGITSQKEWRDLADTLIAYATADGLQPTLAAQTDSSGTVSFTGLQTGIYLIQGVSGSNDAGTCQFENYFLFLPTPQEDGQQNYQVESHPKGSFTPHPDDPDQPEKPEFTTYHVVKLWKDTGIRNLRPDSVTVDILKNGIPVQTVQLNARNNWSYSWNAEKNFDHWTVVEKDVPDEYTVVITAAHNTFTITNSRPAPAGTPPKTGDIFPLLPCIMIMSFSGLLLTALGIWRRRKGA